ncbi:histone-lysine N-methyltransferase, H3 lysine-79 specific-like [Colias croceus]|uniref:histone-lysine N-methyltransferase, H3 lysine-79 specific-like n=1 Tax=Colias crocea TaxID=72248 RepID=UPI001E27D34E|nr:histone-lysine N-methyltransferase, H3 lysine-79 specific-like [Colias croceus]
MSSKGFLLVHKNEWERIARKQNHTENVQTKEDYIKSLNEMSQSWMKSWPDTVQGHVNIIERNKEIERQKNIAFINQFLSKKKDINRGEIIQKAREQIFDDSCYGRQLISALLESKTLEEREIQIEFQKKLQDEANLLEQKKPQWSSLESAADMEKNENDIKRQQRERNIEVARINKAMCNKRKEIEIQRKQREIITKMEDRSAIHDMDIIEAKEMAKMKNNLKQDYEQFVKEQKAYKEAKIKRELEIDNEIEKIKEKQDRTNRKIKAINDKIIKEQCNNSNTAIVYRQIQNIQDEAQKRFDKFIEIGIERLEKAQIEDTKKQTAKQKPPIQNKMNTQIIDQKSNYDHIYYDECVCNRQCIIAKSCKERKCKEKSPCVCTDKNINFERTRNEMVEEYKKRQKQASCWNGLKASHKQFAEQASKVLQDCRYKNTARHVVNDYRRLCHLDEDSLPITNY